jgi:hypothetical protein
MALQPLLATPTIPEQDRQYPQRRIELERLAHGDYTIICGRISRAADERPIVVVAVLVTRRIGNPSFSTCRVVIAATSEA